MTRIVIAEQPPPDRKTALREYVQSITGAAPSDADFMASTADALFVEVERLRALLQQ